MDPNQSWYFAMEVKLMKMGLRLLAYSSVLHLPSFSYASSNQKMLNHGTNKITLRKPVPFNTYIQNNC